MCRNIKPLFNFNPPAGDAHIRAAALQFVRKVSGYSKPSKVNEAAFLTAVDEIAAATQNLLDARATNAPPKDRDEEAAIAQYPTIAAQSGVAFHTPVGGLYVAPAERSAHYPSTLLGTSPAGAAAAPPPQVVEYATWTAAELAARLPFLAFPDGYHLPGIYLLPPIRYPDGHYYLKMGGNTTADRTLSNLKEMQAWMADGARPLVV
jgi:hypothetical protein